MWVPIINVHRKQTLKVDYDFHFVDLKHRKLGY